MPEAAPSSRSFSVSERLAQYGASGLSAIEHLGNGGIVIFDPPVYGSYEDLRRADALQELCLSIRQKSWFGILTSLWVEETNRNSLETEIQPRQVSPRGLNAIPAQGCHLRPLRSG
jgi:hypothetical protein